MALLHSLLLTSLLEGLEDSLCITILCWVYGLLVGVLVL